MPSTPAPSTPPSAPTPSAPVPSAPAAKPAAGRGPHGARRALQAGAAALLLLPWATTSSSPVFRTFWNLRVLALSS
ncbi:hypothetical protein ABT106_09165, partial [Streptomyces sp. NPDC002044]